MEKIILGANPDGKQIFIEPKMANRHGLIAGATGTGKTVTLQILAEQFSKMGVPVFTADVKGDLSGVSVAGKEHPKITERINKIKLENFNFTGHPCTFWDLYGENGLSIRATVSEVGPVLLSRILDLNNTQSDILHMAFKFADDEGLLLLDLKDLREIFKNMAANSKELQDDYGNISKVSVGAIQRKLITLQEAGGDNFFNEPGLDLNHIMQCDFSGNGVINILDATKLMNDKRLYSSFLLWLLSELFENLPELGDPDKPKMVFFFDEAHLLFDDAPKSLVEKIETVVRLIRSKGVGVYFVTQNPLDLPDEILGQLGNRIQHSLRAFTAKDQKAVKAAAETFRPNPNLDTEDVITNLGIGEALISTLDLKGAPQMVEKVLVCPPQGQMGPIDDAKRAEFISRSPLNSTYNKTLDRHSAFEELKKRQEEKLKKIAEEEKKEAEEEAARPVKKKGSNRQSLGEAVTKSILRSAGSSIGRALIRGILGSLKG